MKYLVILTCFFILSWGIFGSLVLAQEEGHGADPELDLVLNKKSRNLLEDALLSELSVNFGNTYCSCVYYDPSSGRGRVGPALPGSPALDGQDCEYRGHRGKWFCSSWPPRDSD